MFKPLSGFTDPNCTGQTDRLFFHENPQFPSAKGTTKKAEALELFVYPNYSCENRNRLQNNGKGSLYIFSLDEVSFTSVHLCNIEETENQLFRFLVL